MTNEIKFEDVRSYATEANLDKGIAKCGLDNYKMEDDTQALRFMKYCTPEGRWTAHFFVSEYFRKNNTGGYVFLAGQHGFSSS